MNGLNALNVLTPVNATTASLAAGGAASAAKPGSPANQARLHHVAQQFEAMFMAEMLRMAHPSSEATGMFAAGIGEKSWQGFMDQALGQAIATGGHTGLTAVIEKALTEAQAKGGAK